MPSGTSYLDALRRLQADFENYKKRVAKQQTDQADRAAESLVDKLLPVLDTADLARAHGAAARTQPDPHRPRSTPSSEEASSASTRRRGPFDPTVHDAVAHEPGDGGHGGGRGAAGRLPLEGPGLAARHGQSAGVSADGTPA